MIDVLLDTLLDAAKLIPFLYLTYLLLEFIEHRAKEQTEALMKKPASGDRFSVVRSVLCLSADFRRLCLTFTRKTL